jgi:hypothetical protein
MPFGFQQYLIKKGFARTCRKYNKYVEDYTGTFLSSYGPLRYDLRKDDKYVWWGLSEMHKPPVMYLGKDKMVIFSPDDDNRRTIEDGYRILFQKFGEDKFDEIYDALITEGKYFEVNCEDEKNITVEIKSGGITNEALKRMYCKK